MASWKKVQMNVRGQMVEGDESMPHTRWWNHLWLLFFWWRQVVVIEALTTKLYRVGFRDFRGKMMLCDQKMTSLRFRAKIGREPCLFFAIDEQDHEVELEVITRVHKKNMRYADVPMI